MDFIKACAQGDLVTLTRLMLGGMNVNAADNVSPAPPARPLPSPSPPLALRSRRPPPPVLLLCRPALTAAADRRRASAER